MSNDVVFVTDDHSIVNWLKITCDRTFLPSSLKAEDGWCTIQQPILDIWHMHVKLQPSLKTSESIEMYTSAEGIIMIRECGCIDEWLERACEHNMLPTKYASKTGWCKVPAQAMALWEAHVKLDPTLAASDEGDVYKAQAFNERLK